MCIDMVCCVYPFFFFFFFFGSSFDGIIIPLESLVGLSLMGLMHGIILGLKKKGMHDLCM